MGQPRWLGASRSAASLAGLSRKVSEWRRVRGSSMADYSTDAVPACNTPSGRARAERAHLMISPTSVSSATARNGSGIG
jgi:hypothetical protein